MDIVLFFFVESSLFLSDYLCFLRENRMYKIPPLNFSHFFPNKSVCLLVLYLIIHYICRFNIY
jgi:hypothetical protein